MIPVKLLITLLPFLALGAVAAPANKRSTPPKKCKAKNPISSGGVAGGGSNAPVPAPTGDSSTSPAPVPAPTPTGESGVSPVPPPAADPTDISSYSVQPMPTGTGTQSGAPAPAPTGLGKGDLKGVPEAPAGMKKAELGKEKRFVGYWSVNHGTSLEGQGPKWPEDSQLKGLTHIILAFVDAKADFKSWQASWTTNWDNTAATTLRGKKDGLKVMGAFGGWNQDAYFREQCGTEAGRQGLADKMLEAVKTLDLDGIDLDWEFPGGNGEVYKDPGQENNPEERFWFVDLVYKLRVGLGPDKLLTAAIPGREADLALGFDKETVPALEKGIDFFNLMTYDIMNRRDNVTAHHSGGGAMLNTINQYKARGMTPGMMTVGFPMYAKYFEAGKGAACTVDKPVGCEFPEYSFEDKMGKDTGKSGVWIMNEMFMTPLYLGDAFASVQEKVKGSWATAQANAVHDAEGMATSAWDADNGIYWTWLTEKDVETSCAAVMKEVGGVMAWSIDQDERSAAGGPRFDALQRCIGAV